LGSEKDLGFRVSDVEERCGVLGVRGSGVGFRVQKIGEREEREEGGGGGGVDKV
jgi:hypothetical protein